MKNWKTVVSVLSGIAATIMISVFGATSAGTHEYSPELMAAWVQATGAIGAILASGWLVNGKKPLGSPSGARGVQRFIRRDAHMLDKLDAEFAFGRQALDVRAYRQELLSSNIANSDSPARRCPRSRSA